MYLEYNTYTVYLNVIQCILIDMQSTLSIWLKVLLLLYNNTIDYYKNESQSTLLVVTHT